MADVQTGDSGGGGGRHQKKRAKKSGTHIDMTPMVDRAFLLLTFFILTTSMQQPNVLQMTYPVPNDEQNPELKKVENAITMFLTKKDAIFYYRGGFEPGVTQLERTDFKQLTKVLTINNKGTTTLVLKDVPADQVIDIIFQQKGLDMRKKGNIMMIAPRDELATREKLDFESRQQISELEPIQLEQFVLNYQKAGDVARLLAVLAPVGQQAIPGQAQRILSKRGNAVADPQSNLLFVIDIPSKLEEIRRFIKAIDIGVRQVLIEARVVEASDTFNRDLGVRMNFLSARAGGTFLH